MVTDRYFSFGRERRPFPVERRSYLTLALAVSATAGALSFKNGNADRLPAQSGWREVQA